MIPAEVKKKENIAEYIIHMYQTEDLIHSYAFNLNDIFEYVIKHMSKDEAVLKEILLWYAGIIEQMQLEKITDNSKRLNSTQNYVEALTTLHDKSLETDTHYYEIYKKAKKDIAANIALSNNRITNPVQICLNGLYGMLLLNLNGKKITAEQKNSLSHFGAVLEYLNKVYIKEQSLK
jgi:hypothetical protein